MWYESKIEKYVNGEWKEYLKFNDTAYKHNSDKCINVIKRLKLGGNTLIEI